MLTTLRKREIRERPRRMKNRKFKLKKNKNEWPKKLKGKKRFITNSLKRPKKSLPLAERY